MKTTILIIAAFVLVLVLTSIAFAQGPPPMLPSSPSQAPIDGGLGILAAAGGAYAWKKLKGRNKEEEIDI